MESAILEAETRVESFQAEVNDPQVMSDDLKGAILRHLHEVEQWPEEQLLERRHARLRAQGVYRVG